MELSELSVVVLETAEAVVMRAMVELQSLTRRCPDGLVSLAAGETFGPFLAALDVEQTAGRINLDAQRFTHHDEFFGFEPTDPGGLAHELLGCPALAKAHADGRFLAIPSGGSEAILREHEEYVASSGGVQLQFLGIGSNGNVACCEPGTSFDFGFHRVELADPTQHHIASRFPADSTIPTEAVTAGPKSILAAERVVLMATGASKAQAVRDMMDGAVESTCPASLLRRHPDAVVLLDSHAAAKLYWPRN